MKVLLILFLSAAFMPAACANQSNLQCESYIVGKYTKSQSTTFSEYTSLTKQEFIDQQIEPYLRIKNPEMNKKLEVTMRSQFNEMFSDPKIVGFSKILAKVQSPQIGDAKRYYCAEEKNSCYCILEERPGASNG